MGEMAYQLAPADGSLAASHGGLWKGGAGVGWGGVGRVRRVGGGT